MTEKTILALAQAHRKEPTRQSYAAMADAVRKLEADRATAERNENTALNAMEKLEEERDGLRKAAQMALEWFDWLNAPDGPISPPHIAKDVQNALRKELSE